jgi:glutamate--cysteine ligase
LPGAKPRASDFTDHLSTIFPEVRLKSFLEMRGADGGPWSRICALPALWVGLLYDQDALAAAWDEVKGWSLEERQRLRDAVPELGLKAQIPGGETLHALGRRILAIAEAGLNARARLNASGDNESGFLDPLREVLASGATPAERLLDRYRGPWQGDISRIYDEESF